MEALEMQSKGIPIGRPAEVNLRNNHAQYIFTWYNPPPIINTVDSALHFITAILTVCQVWVGCCNIHNVLYGS